MSTNTTLTVPPLSEVLASPTTTSDGPLAKALRILFEPSDTIHKHLVPELATTAAAAPTSVKTYAELVDLATTTILTSWKQREKLAFVNAHPRVGERRKQELSELSKREQANVQREAAAAAAPTAATAASEPESESRGSYATDTLWRLNTVYEMRYPGLRYITFVNGRSRAEIEEELAEKLIGIYDNYKGDDAFKNVSLVEPLGMDDPRWCEEMDRAILETGKIAKGRLRMLGIE